MNKGTILEALRSEQARMETMRIIKKSARWAEQIRY